MLALHSMNIHCASQTVKIEDHQLLIALIFDFNFYAQLYVYRDIFGCLSPHSFISLVVIVSMYTTEPI